MTFIGKVVTIKKIILIASANKMTFYYLYRMDKIASRQERQLSPPFATQTAFQSNEHLFAELKQIPKRTFSKTTQSPYNASSFNL